MGWAARANPTAQARRNGLLKPKEKKKTRLQQLRQQKLDRLLARMNGGRDEGNSST